MGYSAQLDAKQCGEIEKPRSRSGFGSMGRCAFLVSFVASIFVFTHRPRLELAAVYAMAVIAMLASTFGSLLCAYLLRARVEDFGIFFGGPVYSFVIGRVRFRINAFPAGSYLKLPQRADLDEPALADMSDGLHFIDDLALLRRLLFQLSGSIFALAATVFLLGFQHAAASFAHGFSQFFAGVFSPRTVGVTLLSQYMAVVASGRYRVAMGVAFAKLTPINLALVGNVLLDALFTAIEALTGIVISQKSLIKFQMLVFLVVTLPAAICISIALWCFLFVR